MAKKSKLTVALILAIVGVVVLMLYVLRPPDSLTGTITYDECNNPAAGVGCNSYSIRIENDDFLGLTNDEDLDDTLKGLDGRKVRVDGEFTEDFFGREIFRVDSVTVVY